MHRPVAKDRPWISIGSIWVNLIFSILNLISWSGIECNRYLIIKSSYYDIDICKYVVTCNCLLLARVWTAYFCTNQITRMFIFTYTVYKINTHSKEFTGTRTLRINPYHPMIWAWFSWGWKKMIKIENWWVVVNKVINIALVVNT